jgi:hypothetical protein
MAPTAPTRRRAPKTNYIPLSVLNNSGSTQPPTPQNASTAGAPATNPTVFASPQANNTHNHAVANSSAPSASSGSGSAAQKPIFWKTFIEKLRQGDKVAIIGLIATIASLIATIAGLIIALYTGVVGVILAKWTARNDILQSCAALATIGRFSEACNETLDAGVAQPPMEKRDTMLRSMSSFLEFSIITENPLPAGLFCWLYVALHNRWPTVLSCFKMITGLGRQRRHERVREL